MTMRDYRQEPAYLAGFAKAFDSEQHPRDERGRWASRSPSDIDRRELSEGKLVRNALWHGTFGEAINSIRRKGLVPSGKGGLRIGLESRAASVYLTNSFSSAMDYAIASADETGTPAVVLRIRLSKSERSRLIEDENLTYGSSGAAGIKHWRLIGSIAPHSIDEYVDGKWRQLSRKTKISKSVADEIFYVVIPIDPDDPIKKMVPYAEAKPYMREDAYIAGRAGAADGTMRASGYFSERAPIHPSGPDQRGLKDPRRRRLLVADMSSVERPVPRTGRLYDGEALVSGDDISPGSRMRVVGRQRTL